MQITGHGPLNQKQHHADQNQRDQTHQETLGSLIGLTRNNNQHQPPKGKNNTN